jgi:hypothetical protein
MPRSRHYDALSATQAQSPRWRRLASAVLHTGVIAIATWLAGSFLFPMSSHTQLPPDAASASTPALHAQA